jgi:hypothetical protein
MISVMFIYYSFERREPILLRKFRKHVRRKVMLTAKKFLKYKKADGGNPRSVDTSSSKDETGHAKLRAIASLSENFSPHTCGQYSLNQ